MAAVGALVVSAHDARSQIISTGNLYQDAAPNFQNANFNDGNSQEGNQIVFAGSATADLVTSFSFQFDFLNSSGNVTGTPNGGEMADVTFYANDGTPVNGYQPVKKEGFFAPDS